MKVTKGHVLCDSIYMKYLEQANLQGQKVDSWCLKLGVGEESSVEE